MFKALFEWSRKCSRCKLVRRDANPRLDENICYCKLPEQTVPNFNKELRGLFHGHDLLPILQSYYGSGLEIGSYRGGGVVFYVDNANRRALVAAMRDLGKFEFGTPDFKQIIANKEVMPEFQGQEETKNLLVSRHQKSYFIAARKASECSEVGYKDWHLPSLAALKQMGMQEEIINTVALRYGGAALVKAPYWSSDEGRAFDFSSRNTVYLNNKSELFVRPVRVLEY